MDHLSTFQPPDLSDQRVLRVVAGLRPCRRGGLRLEPEPVGSKVVVHNYGHGGCGITLSMGTAIAAADLVDQCSSSSDPVAVLGAGIVGLTTARELALRGRRVRIYASKIGHETLSMLAGALFLPVGIDLEHPDIGKQRFRSILHTSKASLQKLDPLRFGVENLTVFEPAYAHDDERYFDNGTIDQPVLHDRLPIPGPPRCGHSFETLFIHTPMMLSALIEDLNDLDVQIVEQSFRDTEDLAKLDESVLINCTALGSRRLFHDQSIYPARGVLVHLEPQQLGYAIHDGFKYMFPRKDALILGGVFDENVWDETPDEQIAQDILTHHRRFFAV
ncbi:MAG: FAD-dependent oxidoreductase [Phycisphaerales bacterium]|nr:FAD-dependent oxidoreductase [Phycisphaerales bacterium]